MIEYFRKFKGYRLRDRERKRGKQCFVTERGCLRRDRNEDRLRDILSARFPGQPDAISRSISGRGCNLSGSSLIFSFELSGRLNLSILPIMSG